jgi:hypothetical protein
MFNQKLLNEIRSGKIVMYRSKPLPVTDTIIHKENHYSVIGFSSRDKRYFLAHRDRHFTEFPVEMFPHCKILPMPRASKAMENVVPQEDIKALTRMFVDGLKNNSLINFHFNVEFGTSANQGYALMSTATIHVPYLLGNLSTGVEGFLEYNTVANTWLLKGYAVEYKGASTIIVSKSCTNLEDKIIFGVWAFLVHELSHILHYNRRQSNKLIDKDSHGVAYRRALSDILSTLDFNKYKEMV